MRAKKAGLEPRSAVKISAVVTPRPEPTWVLEEYLVKVTDENLHEEVETGSPVGHEIL